MADQDSTVAACERVVQRYSYLGLAIDLSGTSFGYVNLGDAIFISDTTTTTATDCEKYAGFPGIQRFAATVPKIVYHGWFIK